MKSLDTFIRIFSIVVLLGICHESYCQLDKKDSLAINLMKAIKITDSINSPLPDSIRNVTIRDFKKLGLNPSDYYTTKDFYVLKTNNLDEMKGYKIHSRQDFKTLDNLDVSEDSWLIAYFKNIQKIENGWVIELYRIGALRDRCSYHEGHDFVGAYGKEGDDILVYYNTTFSKVLKISETE